MNDFKAYSTRALNRSGLEAPQRNRWTRHGSTRKLWKHRDLERAICYVVQEQGKPMAVFLDRSAVVKLENALAAAARDRFSEKPK
jgi:hypothetical protein